MIIPALYLAWHQSTSAEAADLVHKMTVAEKIRLVHGRGGMDTNPVERVGVQSWNFCDGPSGIRVPWEPHSAYYPTGVTMASTWNPSLIGQMAVSMADEALAKGNTVILGPAINIVRTPLDGRAFEYLSEDPFLAGKIAVGYINGVQSRGVVACAKHYAANSIEDQRGTVSAEMDERTLREIYLPAFEMAVKEAHVGSLMAAYNKVNGVYCAENKHLLTDILRDDWKFQGFVMSDWGAVHSTIPTAKSGLDLEMPGDENNYLGPPLEQAVRAGSVQEEDLDRMATHTLATLLEFERRKVKPVSLDDPIHAELARRVAEEGMVLLKNEGVLPLHEANARNVLVVGPLANQKMATEGGSSATNPPYEITPLEGIRHIVEPKGHVDYLPGVPLDSGHYPPIPVSALQTPDGRPGLLGEYFNNPNFEGAPSLVRVDSSVRFAYDDPGQSPDPSLDHEHFSVRWSGYLLAPKTGDYLIGTASDDGSMVYLNDKLFIDNGGDHSIHVVSKLVHLLAGDRLKLRVEYDQTGGEADMNLFWQPYSAGTPSYIVEAANAARSAEQVVLVIGTDHSYDTEGGDKPDLGMPGEQLKLTEEVLNANPNTIIVLVNGSPVEMPWIKRAKAVLESWYGGQENGNALANILFGRVNPSGRLPVTFPKTLMDSPAHKLGDYPPTDGKLKYSEGILVGYRWFDTTDVEPLFPFGHGLSYTTFAYQKLAIHGRRVSFEVKNTGRVTGKEVAQVYVRPLATTVPRAFQELRGFAKVALNPGENQTVSIELPERAFQFWSNLKNRWVKAPGEYQIAVGSSSRAIRLTKSVLIQE
jgi:beta-glucosidase